MCYVHMCDIEGRGEGEGEKLNERVEILREKMCWQRESW